MRFIPASGGAMATSRDVPGSAANVKAVGGSVGCDHSSTGQQVVGNCDAKVFEQGRDLAVEFDANRSNRRVSETAKVIARLVECEPRGSVRGRPDYSGTAAS
jgi:hypothetical protein